MAHGLNSILKRGSNTSATTSTSNNRNDSKTGVGSRRIFAPHFKLQVLDSYRNDADCKGNQRATARKYGIHRRQIQKWLQAENNLRNSIGKVSNSNNNSTSSISSTSTAGAGTIGNNKSTSTSVISIKIEPQHENPDIARKCVSELSLNGRQRDDSYYIKSEPEPRVPCPSPSNPCLCPQWRSKDEFAPLDFSTRGFGGAPSPTNTSNNPASGPMDLSVKRPAGADAAPVSVQLSPVPPSLELKSPLSLARQHPDVWDLSKKRKSSHLDSPESAAPTPAQLAPCTPKPVKLFKPYLMTDPDNNNDRCSSYYHPAADVPPCCRGAYLTQPGCDSFYYNNNNSNHNNNNNNNNSIICDIKSEYCTTYSYTIQELQPVAKSIAYYYPLASPYQPSLEYDSPFRPFDENQSYSQGLLPLKQRHSYSLDFKLSAIDCYYQDSLCRGNQRAVASKYNVHRRQVQKWLKQAEELKQKNDNLKQIHVVS